MCELCTAGCPACSELEWHKAEVERLRALLERWRELASTTTIDCCAELALDGHAEGCELAALLPGSVEGRR